MIKIIVSNIHSKIVGILPEEVHTKLDKLLSYKVANARFMPRVKSGSWDGIVNLYSRSNGQTFLTGLLSLARETLKNEKIEFEIVDRRVVPPQNYPELKFVPPLDFESRDYQDFTVDRSIRFTRGIISIGTGGGKTMVACRIIADLKIFPVLFLTVTKDLMEQAHSVFSACLNVPIGKIGDGNVDIRKITICTVQSAVLALNDKNAKFKIDDYKFDEDDEWDEKAIDRAEDRERVRKLIGLTNVIMLDETHHAAARTIKELLLASRSAYFRYGLSGTPIREDNATILIQALFASKIVDINASYLIKKNELVRPFIFLEPIDSKQNFHSYQKIYENCIVKNEKFNNHVADTVNHLVKRGLSVLVLVQQYKHGDYLKNKIPNSEFINGKLSSEKRLQYINDLRDGKITLISTNLLEEGADIKGLDAVVIASGGKSQVRVNQRIGRSLRRDKNSLKKKDKSIVIVYEHNAKYLDKHAKRIRAILKKEPEFIIIDSKGPFFIKGEIDSVLGVKNTQPSILDL